MKKETLLRKSFWLLSSSVQSQRCHNLFHISWIGFLSALWRFDWSLWNYPLTSMHDIDSLSRNKKLGSWWKLRIKYLADHDQKRDARALFLEFKNDERVRRSWSENSSMFNLDIFDSICAWYRDQLFGYLRYLVVASCRLVDICSMDSVKCDFSCSFLL